MIHPIRRPDRMRTGIRWSLLLAISLWGAIIITYVTIR